MLSRPQKAALLAIMVLAAALAGTAVALEVRPDRAAIPPVTGDHDGAMAEDERCLHMPEHCEGGASGG